MKTYLIHAWCLRPFITTIDIDADTPAEAIAKARLATSELVDAAEECNRAYPWDEFAVYADDGSEILHCVEKPTPNSSQSDELIRTLDYVRATLKLRHIEEASDEEVDEALKIADKIIAMVRNA
jgi:hypothetical protein